MKYLLLVLCVLLSGLIYYQLAPGYGDEYIVDTNDSVAPENLQSIDEPNDVKPIGAYSAIIKRPLFALDRKPPEINKQVIEATIDVDELSGLVIYGVVKSGEVSYAIVGNIDGEKDAQQIKVGRNYKGWRVSEITSDSVKFENEEIEYELFISPDEFSKKSGVKSDSPNSRSALNPGRNNSSADKNVSEGGLIYDRSKKTPKKSPVRIPPSNQLGNQRQLTKEELEELSEEGGYQFNLDELFEDDDEYY